VSNLVKKNLSNFLLLLLITTGIAHSKIDVYPFENKALEKRFVKLIDELRCPKCQNNNLAGSNAGIAKDLKDLVYEKINNGETDKQIVDYLVARYGDFVSYDPPINSRTSVIWFGPFFMLLAGLAGIFVYSRNRSLKAKITGSSQISEENKAMLSGWADDDNLDIEIPTNKESK
jgi:cytochrome c-type biogenesis protein CcmH